MKFRILGSAIALAATMWSPTMGEIKDVVSTIAERLNWPAETSAIRLMSLDGLESCEIYDAYDKRVLDGVSIGVARLKDGSLIVGSEPEALQVVLAKCVSASTPAGTLAELL